MYSRPTKFVKDCNILYDQQYGFRSKHSAQHAILDTQFFKIWTTVIFVRCFHRSQEGF